MDQDRLERNIIDYQQRNLQQAAARSGHGLPTELGAYTNALRTASPGHRAALELPWTDHLENAAPFGPYAAKPPGLTDELANAIMMHESGRLMGRQPKNDFVAGARINAVRGGALLGDRKRGAPDDGRPRNYDAWGPYQLHMAAVNDVNRRYGTKYKPLDRANPELARDITDKYGTMYSGMDVYLDDKGRLRLAGRNTPHAARMKPSYETRARIHNGGPLGLNNPATEKYWGAVRSYLPPRKIYFDS